MKTADALKIGMALGRLMSTVDAWEESKHKRDKNGQFSSTGGGSSSEKKEEKNVKYNTSPEKLVENLKKVTEIKKGAKPEVKKALTELQAGILKEIEKVDWGKQKKPGVGAASTKKESEKPKAQSEKLKPLDKNELGKLELAIHMVNNSQNLSQKNWNEALALQKRAEANGQYKDGKVIKK